jgi:hypothetical protein
MGNLALSLLVLLMCVGSGLAAAQDLAGNPASVAGPALPFGESPLRPGQLRLSLTERTHLIVEPASLQPPMDSALGLPANKWQPKVGLEFKSPDRSVRSLLRIQLQGDSALHFRPRGGGLIVTYQSLF